MSATSSTISFVSKTGKTYLSFCNYDGWVHHVGAMLLINYQDVEKIKQLISMGDLSSLDKNIEPTKDGHSSSTKEMGVCLFYGRDHAQEYGGDEFYSQKNYEESAIWQDFNYVYVESKKKWFLYDPNQKEYKSLKNLVKKSVCKMSVSMKKDFDTYMKSQNVIKEFKKLSKDLVVNNNKKSVKLKL